MVKFLLLSRADQSAQAPPEAAGTRTVGVREILPRQGA
ncbi:hypothetical protein ATK30_0349 [Amycolatopsis echigonensis]|uniref:Uncharacterized protein n=1 Tax=Amycolatopsis echigonensis TaxID=2576905 RepID=A0A2N3WZQ5_9PSEU|nr:hypothetical protein ATK30_0349 [Amycolatopsis niigatensis]